MQIITTLLITSVIFFSCQDKTETDTGTSKEIELTINSEPPEINLTTPDLAVKSFIKFNKWRMILSFKIAEEQIKQNKKYVDRYFTADFPDSVKSGLQYIKKGIEFVEKDNKNITDVKMMTDTRAVVLQQTGDKTTGIDNEKSIVYERYTLTKENDKWLIEKIERTCGICDGTGRMKDYTYFYRDVYKDCDYCGGTGWRLMEGIEFY